MPPEIVSRGIGRDGVGVRRVFPAFVRSGVSLSRAVCGLEIQSVARRWRAGGVRAHLLHLVQPEIEQAVDPVEELRASHEERGMLEPDGRRIRSSHRFFVRLKISGCATGRGGSRRARFATRTRGGVADDTRSVASVFATGVGAKASVRGRNLARGVSGRVRCQPRPLVPP